MLQSLTADTRQTLRHSAAVHSQNQLMFMVERKKTINMEKLREFFCL